MNSWSKQTQWIMRGTNHSVKLVHRYQENPLGVFDRGDVNLWTLYAYVYPEHPMFKIIEADFDQRNAAIEGCPLHGGCTYLKAHMAENGTITSYEFGCDYNHLYDNAHLQNTSEQFYLMDGELLSKHLEEMKGT